MIATVGVNEERPDRIISRIIEQTLREACLDADPPKGCRLNDHRGVMERLFTRANIDLPLEAPYVDSTGLFDEDAYLGDLLRRVEALAQVFDSQAQDKNSAALGLLDATAKPFGGGPYELVRIGDDGTYDLKANKKHTRSAPKIERMEVRIERSPVGGHHPPAHRRGRLDPRGHRRPGRGHRRDRRASALRRGPGISQFGVLFNVRPDRIYFDVEHALRPSSSASTTRASRPRSMPTASWPRLRSPPTSWAHAASPSLAERDVAAANALAGRGRLADGHRRRARARGRHPPLDHDRRAAHERRPLHLRQPAPPSSSPSAASSSSSRSSTSPGTPCSPSCAGPTTSTRCCGAPAGTRPRQRRARVRVVTHHDRGEPRRREPQRLHLRAGRPLRGLGTGDATTPRSARPTTPRSRTSWSKLIPYWPLWYDSATSAVSERLRGPMARSIRSDSRYDWDVSAWSLERGSE